MVTITVEVQSKDQNGKARQKRRASLNMNTLSPVANELQQQKATPCATQLKVGNGGYSSRRLTKFGHEKTEKT